MKWPTFLRPAPRDRSVEARREQLKAELAAADRRRQLKAQLDAALERRKAGRIANAERSRKGARTRLHEALMRDPLFSQKSEAAR